MATLPIGIQTRSLRRPLRRAMTLAAELGADGVEIDARNEVAIPDFTQTALRQFGRLLEDLRMGVHAIAFPTRRGLDDPEDLERRLLAIREAMTFAYKIGARVVIGRGGAIRTDQPNPVLLESLRVLGAHGERVGARYALLSDAGPEAQRSLVNDVGEGLVGVALHPGKLIAAGHSPTDAAIALGPSVLHVHAADAVREAGGDRAAEVVLGRGEADLPEVLAVLEQHNYQGAVTIERRDGDDPATDVANAVAYLRAL